MAVTTVEVTKPHVLVVEGREEELFFGALLKYLELQNVQVLPIGGKTNLRENLKALIQSSGFLYVTSLGIVRDANTDPDAAFQSVRDALQAVNLPAPERSLVPAGDSPRVTVMILPEEGTPGMLEDLCLKAVLPDPAMLCIEQYLQCLQQQSLSLPHNVSKAKVQAFLASRPEAGKRLGEAAQAGYWPWDDATFEQVKNFLQQISSGG
jgi:hypothetical protein